MQSNFLWGAATSSHQVEGNNVHNDWWAAEKRVPELEESGRAADHYNRFREDFALAKQLGHTAHRFSIEWSRLEPKRGHWNMREIAHYREVLEELRRLGMKSFVTLHHFTNPNWLAKEGGWENKRSAEYFRLYTKQVVEHLGDLVDFWVTINEPMVYATLSYIHGTWPPQKKSFRSMWRVIQNLARGHKLAYREIHRVFPKASVGIAKHLVAYLPEHTWQIDDRIVIMAEDWWFNHRFYGMTAGTHDFLGVNYYFTRKKQVHLFSRSVSDAPWDGPVSDMNWPIRPEGLTHVLLGMKRYNKPVYITENGLADAADTRRADFIRGHLRAVEEAQQQGVDVRGYLHWSLLDNFEWAEGFDPRFGLIEVDYETMERRVRPSARVYQAIIEQAQR